MGSFWRVAHRKVTRSSHWTRGWDRAEEEWSQKGTAGAQERSYEGPRHDKYRRAGGEGADSWGLKSRDQQDQAVSWFWSVKLCLFLGKVYRKDGFLGGGAQDWVLLPGRGTGGWERIQQPLLESKAPLPCKAGSVKVKGAGGRNILLGCCFLLNWRIRAALETTESDCKYWHQLPQHQLQEWEGSQKDQRGNLKKTQELFSKVKYHWESETPPVTGPLLGLVGGEQASLSFRTGLWPEYLGGNGGPQV